MSALPEDNTARYKAFYTAVGETHTAQVRAGGVHSPSGFGTWLDGLLTQLAGALYPVQVTKVEFAATGSNIFNIVTTGIEGNAYGTGTPTGIFKPQFVAFQGRSSGGHRARLSFYGMKAEEDDFRFENGENTNVDNAIAFMQTVSPYAYAIDGLRPSWYIYANTGFNAYWQRKNR